jgi:hypothetical protein
MAETTYVAGRRTSTPFAAPPTVSPKAPRTDPVPLGVRRCTVSAESSASFTWGRTYNTYTLVRGTRRRRTGRWRCGAERSPSYPTSRRQAGTSSSTSRRRATPLTRTSCMCTASRRRLSQPRRLLRGVRPAVAHGELAMRARRARLPCRSPMREIAYINSHTDENCVSSARLGGTSPIPHRIHSVAWRYIPPLPRRNTHRIIPPAAGTVLGGRRYRRCPALVGGVSPQRRALSPPPRRLHVVYRCYSAKDGAAESPTSGAVTITDPTGTEQVTAGAMTHTATGVLDTRTG